MSYWRRSRAFRNTAMKSPKSPSNPKKCCQRKFRVLLSWKGEVRCALYWVNSKYKSSETFECSCRTCNSLRGNMLTLEGAATDWNMLILVKKAMNFSTLKLKSDKKKSMKMILNCYSLELRESLERNTTKISILSTFWSSNHKKKWLSSSFKMKLNSWLFWEVQFLFALLK